MKQTFKIRNVKCGGCAKTLKTKLDNNFDNVTINLEVEPRKVTLDIKSEDIDNLKRRLYSFKKEVKENFREFDISTSIGVSCSLYDGDDFDRLVTIADSRMYEAKKSGKDKISFGEEI